MPTDKRQRLGRGERHTLSYLIDGHDPDAVGTPSLRQDLSQSRLRLVMPLRCAKHIVHGLGAPSLAAAQCQPALRLSLPVAWPGLIRRASAQATHSQSDMAEAGRYPGLPSNLQRTHLQARDGMLVCHPSPNAPKGPPPAVVALQLEVAQRGPIVGRALPADGDPCCTAGHQGWGVRLSWQACLRGEGAGGAPLRGSQGVCGLQGQLWMRAR